MNVFFTFQSLFPEAAAGTATMPATNPTGGLVTGFEQRTHESQAENDEGALGEKPAAGKVLVPRRWDIGFHL
jgi:hypothetical protein